VRTHHGPTAQQLTGDLPKTSQDKGEAVAIGWTLAERLDVAAQEREELAARMAWLQRQVMRVSESALSLPVRGQLQTVLRKSIH